MKNPMDKILGKGLQAMLKTIEEELGKLMNQMLQDAVNPEMLADMLKKMGMGYGVPGMDWSKLSGMVGQQPGFDAYKILGLDRSASDEEVKKRYSELLKKLHPDTAGVRGTEFLLQMVLAAHEMIKKERGW